MFVTNTDSWFTFKSYFAFTNLGIKIEFVVKNPSRQEQREAIKFICAKGVQLLQIYMRMNDVYGIASIAYPNKKVDAENFK